jgi:hypothetical protein
MKPEKHAARRRLSKHVQTNTQQEERCSLWIRVVTVARQQPARQWTGWVAITWDPATHVHPAIGLLLLDINMPSQK